VAAPVLASAEAVLFTCEEERRLASISYRPVVGNRVVIRYGTSEPDFNPADYQGPLRSILEGLHDKQKVLFLGRIHPKKGCDLLIETAKRLVSRHPSLHFVMAGPDETHWAGELKQLARQNQVENHFSWLGPVYGHGKWYLYSATDAMILPSHMENFGMTVGEALAVGQPVLLSNKVNIFPSIVRANAGFVDADTVDGTVNIVKQWLETPDAQRSVMKQSARTLYENEFRSIHAAEDLLKVFGAANN
jgi:glycosyltransferase involved in cell wall biosynthesis